MAHHQDFLYYNYSLYSADGVIEGVGYEIQLVL
jgi:hypothetical protein